MQQRDTASFWWFATAWSVAFGIHVIAVLVDGPNHAERIYAIAWTLAPIGAGLACRTAAQSAYISVAQRRSWNTMALACASWLIGQLLWDYDAFVRQSIPAFPILHKVFYFMYAALTVHALGGLADSNRPGPFTMQHLGNLGLIGCCLVVTLLITFFEPVAQASQSRLAIIGSLVHSTLVATTFFASLYYLWTQRWGASFRPMLLLVAATGIYTLGNFVYVHALLMRTYQSADWVNSTWLAMFLLIGLAAHLRASTAPVESTSSAVQVMARRTRLLEAMIPAFLIVMVVLVGLLSPTQLSPRVLVCVAVLLLLFALILGTREAWIQGESQRLTLELRQANEKFTRANLELQDSETRVRDLNAHLEERVAERTRQLQIAYEELEGFAYAVAHDLKAPLRAIDGFGQLLDETLRERSDEQTSQYLSRIRRSAVKMASLIDDLLAYSRIERRALVEQAIDLRRLVDDVVEESAQDIKRRDVEISIDIPALQLHADREGLALVLRNLLQNALKFTRPAQPPRIAIAARISDARLELTIRDNGIGFDMQYHDQIFRLFHRLHRDDQYQGTGIGLALVRKALERMNGAVHASSKEGEGATFTVVLALASSS